MGTCGQYNFYFLGFLSVFGRLQWSVAWSVLDYEGSTCFLVLLPPCLFLWDGAICGIGGSLGYRTNRTYCGTVFNTTGIFLRLGCAAGVDRGYSLVRISFLGVARALIWGDVLQNTGRLLVKGCPSLLFLVRHDHTIFISWPFEGSLSSAESQNFFSVKCWIFWGVPIKIWY